MPSLRIPTTLYLLLAPFPLLAGSASGEISEPTGSLRLADALSLTLAYNPQLKPYSWDLRISEAAAIQASARPNPEISIEVENATGSGAYRGFDAAEESLSLSQTIELGRKRRKRMAVAAYDARLAGHSFVLKRAEVLNSATKAFLDVIAAQEELSFAEDTEQMQRELAAAQESLAESGKVSGAETETGRAAYAFAKISVANKQAQLDAARSELGAFWGNPRPVFAAAVASLSVGVLPPQEGFERALASNPVLAYHAEMVRRHEAAILLEEAQRIPDLSIGVGARHFEDSEDTAALLSFSIPLPLFDRGEGAIAKARAERGKAEEERRSAEAMLRAAVTSNHLKLAAAHREARLLERTALPAARRSHEFAKDGYLLGKFSYLELTAARNALLEARIQHLRARLQFHRIKADLETLTGRTH